jgi:hypothetical protein
MRDMGERDAPTSNLKGNSDNTDAKQKLTEGH